MPDKTYERVSQSVNEWSMEEAELFSGNPELFLVRDFLTSPVVMALVELNFNLMRDEPAPRTLICRGTPNQLAEPRNLVCGVILRLMRPRDKTLGGTLHTIIGRAVSRQIIACVRCPQVDTLGVPYTL